MTINLLDDQSPWTKGSIPPPMDKCKSYKNKTKKDETFEKCSLMSRGLGKCYFLI
jgi:hypothetical protein